MQMLSVNSPAPHLYLYFRQNKSIPNRGAETVNKNLIFGFKNISELNKLSLKKS